VNVPKNNLVYHIDIDISQMADFDQKIIKKDTRI
jgi:hypothetical protein